MLLIQGFVSSTRSSLKHATFTRPHFHTSEQEASEQHALLQLPEAAPKTTIPKKVPEEMGGLNFMSRTAVREIGSKSADAIFAESASVTTDI